MLHNTSSHRASGNAASSSLSSSRRDDVTDLSDERAVVHISAAPATSAATAANQCVHGVSGFCLFWPNSVSNLFPQSNNRDSNSSTSSAKPTATYQGLEKGDKGYWL